MQSTLTENNSKQLKTTIFKTLKNISFIIVNLVNKGILHFLITNGLSTDCSMKEFIHRFFGRALHENAKCINFQFHNLKFSQEKYFGFAR